jgi:hypothetical protein
VHFGASAPPRHFPEFTSAPGIQYGARRGTAWTTAALASYHPAGGVMEVQTVRLRALSPRRSAAQQRESLRNAILRLLRLPGHVPERHHVRRMARDHGRSRARADSDSASETTTTDVASVRDHRPAPGFPAFHIESSASLAGEPRSPEHAQKMIKSSNERGHCNRQV